jgi:hypothetical protein
MTVSLDYAPPNKAALLVFISGVRQDTDAYTISGTSLTFTGSVESGTDNVQVVHLGLTVQVPAPADDTITTAKIQDDAVTTAKILDANVTNAKLANMAANTVKVRDANSSGVPSDVALATTEILIGDGTGFTAASLSSDVTMTNAGAVTIANDAVTTAKILDNNVTLAKLDDGTQGDILYYGASGAPARLGFGTSGDFLKTQGTGANPVWAAAGGGAWELVASVTATANTSTIIGGDGSPIFSSAHDNYVLIGLMQTKTDVLTSVLIQPILVGAGTTPDSTGNIQHVAPMMRSNAATGTTALTWSDQDLDSNYAVSLNYNPLGSGTGEAHAFQMWFYDPFQNASFSHYQLANATVASFDANAYTSVLTYAYKKATSTGYVGLSITNGSAGGVDYLLRLYGIKNS